MPILFHIFKNNFVQQSISEIGLSKEITDFLSVNQGGLGKNRYNYFSKFDHYLLLLFDPH
jgi:hypothetical protein